MTVWRAQVESARNGGSAIPKNDEEAPEVVGDETGAREEHVAPDQADHERRDDHRQEDEDADHRLADDVTSEKKREAEAEPELQEDRLDGEDGRQPERMPEVLVLNERLVLIEADEDPLQIGLRQDDVVAGED